MNTKYFTLIFYISLALSLLGITSEIYDHYYDYEDSNLLLLSIISKFKSIYVNIGFEYSSLNIYNVIFYVLLFFGSLFFYFSKGKENRLLKFFYSVLLITNIFWIIFSICQHAFFPVDKIQLQDGVFSYYLNVIINTILIIGQILLSYWFLKLLTQNSILIKVVKENSNTINFTNTKKIERLFHLIIDTVIMLFLFFIFANFVHSFLSKDENYTIPEFFNNRLTIAVVAIILNFIYYPFFETIFGATPGKFLTSSQVVNTKAENPNLKNIFLRTLCRQIPFDALSFFGKYGWHDSLSETHVVKEENENSYGKYIVILLILSFLVPIYFAIRDMLHYFF